MHVLNTISSSILLMSELSYSSSGQEGDGSRATMLVHSCPSPQRLDSDIGTFDSLDISGSLSLLGV